MKYFLILIFFSIGFIFSGCISFTKVTTAYPFEKRYDYKTIIIVNGEKINIPKKKSVWILSEDTLYNLLSLANDKTKLYE